MLQELLADLLEIPVEQLDIDNSPAALGLDSLAAAELHEQIFQRTGITVPIEQILAADSLADILTAGCQTDIDPASNKPEQQLSDPEAGDPCGLVGATQQALYFQQMLAPQSPAYHLCVCFHSDQTWGSAAIGQAMLALLERHPELTAVFSQDADGQPVKSYLQPRLELFHVEHPPIQGDAEALSGQLQSALNAPLDMSAGPLFRLEWFPAADGTSVFLFIAHHMIMDLWSFSVALGDFVSLLKAAAAGEPLSADLVCLQQSQPFSAFVGRQAALPEDRRQEQQNFWQRLLHKPPPPRLRFDEQAEPVPVTGSTAERYHFELDPELSARLKACAQTLQVSMNSMLLALYGMTLSRFACQDDVLIGVPVAGRRTPEFAHTVGCFINTVIVRMQTGRPIDLSGLVQQTHAAVMTAYEHQDIGFHHLTRWLHTDAPANEAATGLPGTRLQSVFILQQTHKLPGAEALVLGQAGQSCEIGGCRLQSVALAPAETPFDIGLMMVEHHGRLWGRLEFRPALISARLVAGMADCLQQLASLLVTRPTTAIQHLDVLNDQQRARWSAASHGARLEHHTQAGICSRFMLTAQQYSQHIALEMGEQHYSYQLLAEHAARLGTQLLSRGIGLEQRVVVMTERAPLTVMAMLGVWYAGAVYVPIDGTAPAARIAQIMDDCQPACVIAGRQTAALVPAGWRQNMLDIDSLATAAAAMPVEKAVEVDGDNLAYIIYTSGSEGLPKGVMASHAGALNFARAQAKQIGLDASFRLLQVASFGFDASMSDVLMSLLNGATLVIANPAERLAGTEFKHVMQHRRIQLLTTAASLLEAVEEPDFDALKIVISTAEACTDAIVRKWGRRYALYNGYGPTETTVGATLGLCRPEVLADNPRGPGIGVPFDNCSVYLLDKYLQPAPPGVRGEVYIGGLGVTRGYLNNPGKTAAAFLPDPFAERPGQRVYRSGDYARQDERGGLEFVGRRDQQLNIRGHRVEVAEIERVLGSLANVAKAAVISHSQPAGELELLACVQPVAGISMTGSRLRAQLAQRLPTYMLPAAIRVADIPLNANGKIDRVVLRQQLSGPPDERVARQAELSSLEQTVAAIWEQVLGHPAQSRQQNFFDAGGHSLALAKVQAQIAARLGQQISMPELLQHHTIAMLARRLAPAPGTQAQAQADTVSKLISGQRTDDTQTGNRSASGTAAIAIIGIGCRFPGAEHSAAFWDNLASQQCGVRFFSPQELAQAGVPAELFSQAEFVPARAVLDDPYAFDAGFFGCSEREAQLLDPQRRVLLECAFEALQQAGYGHSEQRDNSVIGAYLSASGNSYFDHHIRRSDELNKLHGGIRLSLASDKSFTATYVAYKLHLSGPAVTVDTACSSSLVAVHQACQSIRNGDCRVALAGGMSIDSPLSGGHLYEPSGIGSRDGYCRAFDAAATGTVKGMGGGVVVLKELSQAERDGDLIHAVIYGSAVNNDAGRSAGFTAPSAAGQSQVIRAALDAAGLADNEIDFIEAHGTGTPLGDPIEFAALRDVFTSARPAELLVGSVKSNIGHLDAAAGIAGLIKTTLALEQGICPATLHVAQPNPELKLAQSSLTLATAASALPTGERRCYAGVSSFGMGGTNCHVVLGQSPATRQFSSRADPDAPPARSWLLPVAAHSASALQGYCARLAEHLPANPELSLAQLAYNLGMNLTAGDFRAGIVAATQAGLIDQLHAYARSPAPAPMDSGSPRQLAFVLPGQAGQRPGLATGLYAHEAVFRTTLEQGLALLEPGNQTVCRDWLLQPAEDAENPAGRTNSQTPVAPLSTEYLQPALFCYEYALCRYLQSLGLEPDILLGHSLGEIVAAAISGTLSFAAAVKLVEQRGRLISQTAGGAMLVVGLDASALHKYLRGQLEIALYNSASECVVSGPRKAIEQLHAELTEQAVYSAPVASSHAFHWSGLDRIMPAFRQALAALDYAPPGIPWVSNTTGSWITGEQAVSADYWVAQMRQPVQFNRAISTLLKAGDMDVVIVGAGGALQRMIQTNVAFDRQNVLSAGPSRQSAGDDLTAVLNSVRSLWESGRNIDWRGYFHANQHSRQRMILPPYYFDRQHYNLGSEHSLIAPPAVNPVQPKSGSDAGTGPDQPAAAELSSWLRAAWQDLLGLREVQPDSDFFAAGGDSLAVLRLCGLLSEQWRVKLKPRQIMAVPGFAAMAELISAALDDLPAAPLEIEAMPPPRRAAADAETAIPLSYQQRRMWFQHALESQPSVLNLPVCLSLTDTLDQARLNRSFRLLLRRHPALRARLYRADGEIYQRFERDPERFAVPLDQADEQTAHGRMQTLAEADFDLEQDWLIRACAIQITPARALLVIVCHHIICDGHSLVLLLRDWLALYRGAALDNAAEHAIEQLRNYIEQQASDVDNGVFDQQLDYWSRQLSDMPTIHLPGELQPGTAVEASRGRTLAIEFGEDFAAQLRRFCQRHQLTPYVVMLAVGQCLIARYTQTSDISIGVPVSQRHSPALAELAGLFVNTVVVRTRLSPAMSFAEVCRQVQRHVGDALLNSQVPFDVVVERLAPSQAGRTRAPLFRAAFVMETDEQSTLAADGQPVAVQAIEKHHAQFELGFWLRLSETALSARLEYRKAGFSASCMARCADDFGVLARQWIKSPEQTVWDAADTGGKAAREISLLSGPAAEAPPEGSESLAGLLQRAARRYGARPALCYGDAVMSYRQLEQHATRLAAHLRFQGVACGDSVGIYLARSLELPVAMLAVLKCAAVMVPLEAELPPTRLLRMLVDSGARIVITHSEMRATGLDEMALEAGVDWLEVDRLGPVEMSASNHQAAPSAIDAPAYIIYTSGSTGAPKGVINAQRGLVNRLLWMNRHYQFGPNDRFLHKTPISFDVSLWELFCPLLCGARVVITRPGEHRDPRALQATMAKHAINVVHFVPAMLKAYLAAAGKGADSSALRYVFCSGEGLPATSMRQAREQLGPKVRIINLYGPTEASIEVSHWEYPGHCETRVAPLGVPIDGVALYILDADLRPVPPGVTAELYLAGECVALGYRNRGGLTAQAFVPDPFHRSAGARMYRTGDRARLNAAGVIEFLGRVDDQIKIHGFRIEPGEIEATLLDNPLVIDAAVVCDTSQPAEPHLLAYVVFCRQQSAEQAAGEDRTVLLRQRLSEQLPNYMLPASIIAMSALPLGANGKLDRAALPQPQAMESPALHGELLESSLEQQLAESWREVLGVAQPHRGSDFFAAGGSSIAAIRLADRIEARTGRECSIRLIFSQPKLADMAIALQDAPLLRQTSVLPELQPEPQHADQPFELTDLQNAYWVGRSHAFEMGNIATHGYLELDVRDLDTDVFRAAVRQLIERHDSLRLVVDEQGMQRVLPQVPEIDIEAIDLRELSATEQTAQIETLREQLAHAVYDPAVWPLFEFRVVWLDADISRIFISIDALLVDGWTIQLLEHDLNVCYRQLLEPQQHNHFEPAAGTLRLRDYVQAVSRLRELDAYQRARHYWQRKLPHLPPAPPLPLARDPGSIEQPEFIRLSTGMGRRCSERLRALAAQHNASLSALLLTAYAEILASWSNATAFSLNLTISDRVPLHPGVEQLAGNLSTLLILGLDMSQPASFAERLRTVRNTLLDDMQQRYYSGIQVLRQLAAERRDRTSAQMPVVFTSLVDIRDGQADEREKVFDFSRPDYAITQTSQAWLDCNVAWSGGELMIAWDAVASLFPAGMLEYFHAQYAQLLTRLADVEECWTRRPPPLFNDRQHLLWQSAAVSSQCLGSGQLLHELFIASAQRYPERVAIYTAEREITYRELARMANVLAQRLHRLGARRNSPVAVIMRNGWEQVVACLSVLLAGAPYLPIDAAAPVKRWEQLLESGECALVLTPARLDTRAIANPGRTIIQLDETALQGTAPELTADVSSHDLAYVIFTSGSTGQPKGVMIDHRGAVNTVLDINQRYAVDAHDAVLALSSFTFDLSVYDMFGLLGAGGKIVIPDPADARDPAAWLSLIRAQQVTLWNAVPALTEMLVDYRAASEAEAPPGLRLWLVSGDWIPVSLPRRTRQLCPGSQFISLGGATEASIWSISYPVEGFDESQPSIPYGRALTAQSMLVLDHDLRVCPPGVTGQIVIGGVGVAQGYWRNPEQSAASFINHPVTGQRCYLSGDCGRYIKTTDAAEATGSATGQAGGAELIEFLGRADNQVKIRGHRIELGEIEHVITSLPGVDSAAVKLHQPPEHGASLLAYLTIDGGSAANRPGTAIFRHMTAQSAYSWTDLSAAVQAEADHPRLDVSWSAAQLTARMPVLNQQYEQALLSLFARLGMLRQAGERLNVDELLAKGGIAARYQRWLLRALRHLSELGYVRQDGPRWQVLQALREQPEQTAPAIEFDLLEILTERQSSAELYLSDATITGYQEIFALCHSMICAAVESLLKAHANGPLSILEVGAGHGSCTRHVLPLLPADTDYVFTDISPYFLNAARENFAAHDFVRYALFNLDDHPQLQGMRAHSYDLIIAASVLHDIRDIRSGLSSLYELLKPGGTLLMIEETRFFPFFDLGMGLQQGFDGFTDTDLRQHQPLLSRQQWQALLCETGFASVQAVNRPGSASELIGFDVIMARMPAELEMFDETLLEQQLREWLPDYMLPARFIRLRRMPLTANGKLDRNALPSPPDGARGERLDYTPPHNQQERLLADIWQDVLGHAVVGVEDNFFELGGDSLLAVQLATRIQAACKVEFPVRAIFEAPTIRQLGYLLDLSASDEPVASADSGPVESKPEDEAAGELVRGRL